MSWNLKPPASLEAFLEIAWLAGGLPFVGSDRGNAAHNLGGHVISDEVPPTKVTSGEAVVEFWRAAGPTLWFAKDHGFRPPFSAALSRFARGGGPRRAFRLAFNADWSVGVGHSPRSVPAQWLSRNAAHVRNGPNGERGCQRCDSSRLRQVHRTGNAAVPVSAVWSFGKPVGSTAIRRAWQAAWRTEPFTCTAALRHRPEVWTLSASQSDFGAHHAS